MASFEPSDAPNPIVTLEDLIANADVVRAKEAMHRRVISTLSTVFNQEGTKENMLLWALSGFRPAFVVHELNVEPPSVCSDGVKRDVSEYLNFVSTPYTVSDHFAALEACLPGIQVTYSFSTSNTILLHVTKK